MTAPIPELRRLLADRTHLVEFHQDGWTVLHPMSERLDGSLFHCTVSFHHLDGPPPSLGLFYVTDEGDIGDPCPEHDLTPALNIADIIDAAEALADAIASHGPFMDDACKDALARWREYSHNGGH